MLAMVLLIIDAAALVAGIVLTGLGLRGRVIDDHPVCRECGRDLHGLSDLERCPECGTPLAEVPPRIGNRQRRRKLVAAGVLIGFPAVLWLGGLAVVTGSGLDTMAYKPVWLLALEAGGGNGPAAVAELRKRYDAGELSPEQTSDLVERFLADQGDLEQEWDRPKGTFIEHVAVAGGVSPEQWQRYVEQGAAPAMRVREKVRAGEALPVWFEMGRTRFGGPSSPFMDGRGIGIAIEAHVDDEPVAEEVIFLWVLRDPTGIGIKQFLPIPASEADRSVSVNVNIAKTWPPASDPFTSHPQRRAAEAVEPQVLERVEVLPPDEPDARAVASAEMEKIFADSMRLNVFGHQGPPLTGNQVEIDRFGDEEEPRRLQFLMHRRGEGKDPLPISVAAEVWVEWDGGRTHLTDMALSRHRNQVGSGVGGKVPPDFDAKTVTVRLVPSLEVAESTPDITQYWDQEWVWEDVEVVWPE